MFKKGKRYKFAFFTSYIDGDEYNRKLINSINEICSDKDIDLVMFPSRNINNEEIHKNMVLANFNFFNPNFFDGIILSSSSLLNFIGIDLFNEILENYITIPAVSIGLQCKQIPAVTSNNQVGFTDITYHLLKKHNYKNFIFISGKKDHPEAKSRLNSFLEVMKKENIEFKKDMIIYGNFTRDLIKEPLNQILKKYPNTQAIVCANDTMAREVIDILNKEYINVPNKIAVTGYDDSISANLEIPRITTSSQESIEISKSAINILISQIESKEFPMVTEIEPKLKVNESCGCIIDNSKESQILVKDSFYSNLKTKMDKLKSNNSIILQIKEDLYSITTEERIKKYKSAIVSIIGERYTQSTDVTELKELSELGLQIINILKEYEIRNLLKHHIQFKKESTETRILLDSLLSSESLDSLFFNLNTIFNKININTYYVILSNPNKNDHLRLFHGVHEGEFIDCKKREISVTKNSFIPLDLITHKNRKTLISIPLFSLNKFFGFILIDSKNIDIGLLENIHMSLSATIMNILSITTLKETQDLLIESEKMAFLGNMVAGVAHEINTPVGISITASSFLKDIMYEQSDIFNSGKLKKSELTNFFNKGKETIELIDRSLKNTTKIIEKFKEVSTNSDYDNISKFKVIDAISETKALLKDTLVTKNININVFCSPDISITTYKSALIRVLNNLINNSIMHAFTGVNNPKILISVSETEESIKILYKDNGIGCSESKLKQIYNPFYTTKRGEGFTGLGLSIVHNLVKIRLNGDILTENCIYKGLKTKIIITK